MMQNMQMQASILVVLHFHCLVQTTQCHVCLLGGVEPKKGGFIEVLHDCAQGGMALEAHAHKNRIFNGPGQAFSPADWIYVGLCHDAVHCRTRV